MIFPLRPIAGPLAIEQVSVAIRGLTPAHEGLCIAHLSDFHFDGLRLSMGLLEQAIDEVNAARPDLVALTGDFVTKAPEPTYELARHLGRIRSRYGLVACLGNHDNVLPRSRSVVTQALAQAGVEVLWNRIAYPLGPELPVVGLADFWSKSYDPDPVLAQLPPDRPRLVLSHNPDTADPLARWRVDLQLSGHTHGGQVVLPGVGPLVVVQRRLEDTARRYGLWPWPRKCYVVRHLDWLAGLHRVGENQLYVNRGLGTYAPGRLGCPPEVTLIRLVGA